MLDICYQSSIHNHSFYFKLLFYNLFNPIYCNLNQNLYNIISDEEEKSKNEIQEPPVTFGKRGDNDLFW